ncbi:hydrogenase iron-sulfur subunit [candidate division WOR-3 bacterium]|nr:hydrogenase iron-sulfur subunit [candidate division WOR-3 bacterium]
MEGFEPKIVAFCCKWCSYAAADLAGTSRLKIKPNFVVIRTMCSSRVDPEFILQAFLNGADGVLVAGCHPGDCHYVNGNYKTLRRVMLLKKVLEQLGIDPRRLRLEWIAASESRKFVVTIRKFVDELKQLGPLRLEAGDDNGSNG